MSMEQMIGLAIALMVMLVGLIGNVMPGIPGTPLVLAGVVGHKLYFGDASVSNWMLFLIVVLAVLALALDYLASMIGAKKLGATWRGVLGAVLGAIVGIFFSLPGLLLGPFIGAVVLEVLGGRELRPAAKAGLGAFVGLVFGAAGKLACSVVMIALFAVNVLG